jgi:N6-adenosine-specific RNA methylase IME4
MKSLDEFFGRFKVIYTDNPWLYWGDPDKDQAAGKHYNMMSYEELVRLPVRALIDDPGVIFMWATGPKLAEAVDLIRAWNFYYRGIGYFWIKTTKDGHVIEGQGVRPSFVKNTVELVLIGSTEPRGRTLPIYTEKQSQLIFEPDQDQLISGSDQLIFAPRPNNGTHSAKPDEARWRIEELFGDVPRIELFARKRYSGWTAWGFEAEELMPSSEARSPKLREKLEALEASQRIMSILEALPQEK